MKEPFVILATAVMIAEGIIKKEHEFSHTIEEHSHQTYANCSHYLYGRMQISNSLYGGLNFGMNSINKH